MRPSNELAAPEGLSWDGDTAKWNAVTDATGYSVQLYKNGTEDGNKVGSPVSATGTSHDFSATFQSEGDGTYYFAVQATGSKDSSLWSDPSAGHEVSKDTTAPTLSEGSVAYTSKTTAEGSFKTNEGGQYYIQAVASGEAAPTIDVSGAGTSCQAGTVSFTLDSLDGGAKDVYVVVKDSAGNKSTALKIDLAAYVAKTYSVTCLLRRATQRRPPKASRPLCRRAAASPSP